MGSDLFLIAASRVRANMFDPGAQETAVRDAAGLPAVVTPADMLERLESLEKPSEVVGEMVEHLAEATEDTKIDDEWVADLIRRHARAMQVEQLRIAVRNSSRGYGALRDKRGGAEQRFGMVAEPVARLLSRLAELVDELPDGTDALHPDVNIDAGTTASLLGTRDVLTRLGTIAGYLPSESAHGISSELLLLLDTPAIEVGQAERAGKQEDNPSPARTAMKAVRAIEGGTDGLLVDLARGRYKPLSLGLASDRRELTRRVEQVANSRLVEFTGRRSHPSAVRIRPALEAS